MATVRNISEHALDLRCIGRSVEPDEKVDVPDDVFDGFVWPSTVWDVSRDSAAAAAAAPKPAKKTTAKKSTASEE